MKTQKDINEIWSRVDVYEKKLQAREEELEKLIKEYRTKALNIQNVSGSLPTNEEVTEWVCKEFKVDGLDFDEDVKTQYGYLPEYFMTFAKWLKSNDR